MAVKPLLPTILSFEDARRVVEQHASQVQPATTETVELLSACGRVLAEPIFADRDLPPFPRSARDGYAVRAADLDRLPARLQVVGEIKAGAKPEGIPLHIATGQAASIMTGAPVPDGADAVVMVEYTTRSGDSVEIERTIVRGENIVPRGAEASKRGRLLDRGLRIEAAAIALAASAGKTTLSVYSRPRVSILATGDELVGPGADPGPTQIRNSNSYSLAAQVRNAGGEPILMPIAPDERQALRRLLEEGTQSDLLLITGGVSVGRYDLVEQVLSDLKAEFFFTGAEIQPGRPVVFGRCPCGAGTPFDKLRASPARESKHTYFFGLPGNPVSTMVTFELFARPMLEALAGQSPSKLTFLHARLKTEIRVKPGLRRFLPALLSGQFDHAEVERVAWQGSGDIAATARANCYVVIPPDKERISAGEWIAVMLR